jgi:hypothetical protein
MHTIPLICSQFRKSEGVRDAEMIGAPTFIGSPFSIFNQQRRRIVFIEVAIKYTVTCTVCTARWSFLKSKPLLRSLCQKFRILLKHIQQTLFKSLTLYFMFATIVIDFLRTSPFRLLQSLGYVNFRRCQSNASLECSICERLKSPSFCSRCGPMQIRSCSCSMNMTKFECFGVRP